MNRTRILLLLSLDLILVGSCVPSQPTLGPATTTPPTSPPSTPTYSRTTTPTPTSTSSPTPSPTFPPAPTPTAYPVTIIDTFEGRGSPYPWTFTNCSPSAGATGSVSLGPGYSGEGAYLAFNFTGDDAQCVRADLNMRSSLYASVIAFWIKSPPGPILLFNALDSTGQTLQYWPARPLEATDPDAWYRLAIQLDAPDQWWGGASDGTVHGRIRRISIGVTNGLYPDMHGTIALDDVIAIPPTPLYVDPTILPVRPAPPGSGDLRRILGVNVHSHDFYETDLDAAGSAGFSFVRTDLSWPMVAPSRGHYDFRQFDEMLALVEARGMRMHFILSYGNHLYTGCDDCPPTTPASLEAFGRYAQAAAAHFAGHGITYDVYPEPDQSSHYADPSTFAALLREAIDHVRQGDPTASVATGGLSAGASTIWPYDYLRAFLAAGGASGYDSVGHDCYLFNFPPEHVADLALLYRSIVQELVPVDPPVWCTEVGYSSSDFGVGDSSPAQVRHSVLVSRLLLSRWAAGYPLIVYYELRDGSPDPNDHEGNFGLLAYDHTEKPAMQAARTLMGLASSRTFVGMVPLVPTSMHALRMDGQQDTVLAVWLDTPGQQLSVEVPPGTYAIDFLGGRLSLEAQGPYLALTLREADGPVYLTFPRR